MDQPLSLRELTHPTYFVFGSDPIYEQLRELANKSSDYLVVDVAVKNPSQRIREGWNPNNARELSAACFRVSMHKPAIIFGMNATDMGRLEAELEQYNVYRLTPVICAEMVRQLSKKS